MSKAKDFMKLIEEEETYNNPPTKHIPSGQTMAVGSAVKKYLGGKGIEAEVTSEFRDVKRGKKMKGEMLGQIKINLKNMTVDEFNGRSDLHEFNRLIANYNTDWGIVGNTILVGKI